MKDRIQDVLKRLQQDLEQSNIEDFFIVTYDRRGKLVLAGSFDFCYYHDVEIIFHDVSFICCPGSTFTVNHFGIAEETVINNLSHIMNGYDKEGSVISLSDTFSNTSYYIGAHDVEYKFHKVKYYDKKQTNEYIVSDWAKERCRNVK